MKYFIIMFVLAVLSCSDQEDILQYEITPETTEGYYLGAVLDSGKRFHSRSVTLPIELRNVSYFSDCLLGDLFARNVEGFDEGNLEIVFPVSGVFEPNCPVQDNLSQFEYELPTDEFPLSDSLIIWGESDYLRNDSLRIIGSRQGLIPLDTIELRWGQSELSNSLYETDSLAQLENPIVSRKLLRLLTKDSTANFYLKVFESTCPVENVNQDCFPIQDTAQRILFSERDQIDDTTEVQVELDTMIWTLSLKCSNQASYCNDVEISDSISFNPDTNLALREFETIALERLPPCKELSRVERVAATPWPSNKNSFPPSARFEFQKEIFIVDSLRDNCRLQNHYYAYNFNRDSLIIDQLLLDSLWKDQ